MLRIPTGRRLTSWLFAEKGGGVEFATTEEKSYLEAGRIGARELQITTAAP